MKENGSCTGGTGPSDSSSGGGTGDRGWWPSVRGGRLQWRIQRLFSAPHAHGEAPQEEVPGPEERQFSVLLSCEHL